MITIKECKTADTRTATELVSKEVLLSSSLQHIEDIKKAMYWMADMLKDASCNHDFTKLNNINQFHSDCIDCQLDNIKNFKTMKWFQLHITEERHHLQEHVSADVNLFDVLEFIADNVMAGLARTGTVRNCTLPDGLLESAYTNTIALLNKNVEVVKQ